MTLDEAIANINMIRVAFVDPVTKEQRKLIDDTLDTAIKALEQQPSDTVSRGAYEQVMWERDVAIGQLKELGYGLGQKIELCEDCISRKAVLDAINNNRFRYTVAKEDACTGNVLWDSDLIDSNVVQDISNLPSVTPKSETVTEFADRCRECGARYGKLLKQKYGKWIGHPEIETSTPEYLMFYECSECGDKQCFCKSDIHKKRFCSNCGAKMQESEE